MEDVLARALKGAGNQPLSIAIARAIGDAIVSGEIAHGTPLPSEKTLGERLDVGRSSVREALRILQAQGLVTGGERITTRGPVVDGAGASKSAAAALHNVMMLGQVPLADLLSLRLLIERSAIEAAARAPDEAALREADAALATMRSATGDVARFHEADVAFHAALIAASGNTAFALVMNVLRETMARHLREALEDEPDLVAIADALIAEHEAILVAIRRGHGSKASALVEAHISAFYRRADARAGA